jgi:U4/U6 small nuclear ribonucleoprotein SNU13
VELVILAADTNPLEMLMNIPNICEEKVLLYLKNVPYCYVPNNTTLGRACGIKRPVIASAVLFKEGS